MNTQIPRSWRRVVLDVQYDFQFRLRAKGFDLLESHKDALAVHDLIKER
jgi:hypothetical protein